MGINDGGLGDIFDEGGLGRSADDLEEVLDHLTHLMTDHDMPASVALEGLLNILKPGSTETSHDVLAQFRVCMFLQGQGDVLENINALWLTAFPWGLGFHLGLDKDFATEQMSFETKRAMIRSLCAILQAGNIPAEMTDKDRIKITDPSGREQNIDIDTVISEFRSEMEAELGPDALIEPTEPDQAGQQITDWMKRWLPDD
jgi:hypothetical protein